MLKRAKKGDRAVLPQLRALFDGDVQFRDMFDIGKLARQAIIVPLAAGRDVAVRDLMYRQIARLASELAGPDPTPIEHLLAERVAFCWHAVHQYERGLAQAEDLSIAQADFHQRKIDAAHRRYLSALKTLATVRRLAVPALQVNIARNQFNVASPSSSCPRETLSQ